MSVTTTRAAAASSDLFGHPRGLTYLFATEMWERFSYYGMRALLTLYMVKYLFQPGHAESVIGYAQLKGAYESLLGPLGVQPFASHIYGDYTALVYLTPILGGLLADRVLGQRRTVLLGASLMAVGHFMMASERLMLLALLVLILGNGAFKPNISTQVGLLYPPGDPRRDRAFSIFYVGINIGAFLSPLVCGTLAIAFGWHYGFAAAGIGMLIGLAIYLWGSPALPSDGFDRGQMEPSAPLNAEERRRLGAIAILFVPVTLFWATYEQQGNTIALWAEDYTNRTFDLGFWRGEIPAEWFQSFNPFLIFAFTPFIVALWTWQSRRGREPTTVTKMAIGCFGVALANLVLVAAAAVAGAQANGAVSWLWLAGYFVIITVGELYLSPTGLSLVTKVAPVRYLSMTMGVWLATSFLGNFIAGWLGSFWTGMDKRDFFLMLAAIAAAAAVVILICNGLLRRALKES
ncbi:MAG: peptide MFS transporter [Xanthobacteraceae bacterium]|jgi:POT family proton-dependent oligopeptide transporter